LADRLAPTRIRPNGLTLCGLAAALAAAAVLGMRCQAAPWAGGLVLLAWFFDRADGQLARRQGSASALGAWLDANVDELADLGLHAAVAMAAAAHWASSWPWALLIAFYAGKYLLMYGLNSEAHFAGEQPPGGRHAADENSARGACRWLYHLPASADVRIHLLIAALCTGYLATELAFVAVYYNLRWIVRYALVARRLGGVR
jgi:phosphatidylglycerophosphate synthase